MAYRRNYRRRYRRRRSYRGFSIVNRYQARQKRMIEPDNMFTRLARQTSGRFSRISAGIGAIINSEVKVVDTSFSETPASGTPVFKLLSGVAQGDDVGQRDGRSILLKDLVQYYVLTKHASATQTHVRMILFVDKQQQGTTATVGDLLAGTSNVTIQPMSVNNGDRFVVLFNKTITLTTDKPSIYFKVYKKGGWHIKYSGSNSTNTLEGNIYLMLNSDEATNTPTILGSSRIKFYDN